MVPMKAVFSFPGGVRVISGETGEVLYERGDEPLEVVRGRLVPLRDRVVRYAVLKGRWIRRQLADRHPLTATQEALGRRLKRDLANCARGSRPLNPGHCQRRAPAAAPR